jgi:hypothetical protein
MAKILKGGCSMGKRVYSRNDDICLVVSWSSLFAFFTLVTVIAMTSMSCSARRAKDTREYYRVENPPGFSGECWAPIQKFDKKPTHKVVCYEK